MGKRRDALVLLDGRRPDASAVLGGTGVGVAEHVVVDAVSVRERLTAEEVRLPVAKGHVRRYALAAAFVRPGDVVMDVACGVGYGAAAFRCVEYDGYDRPGVADDRFLRLDDVLVRFYGVDLNDPGWRPVREADVTCCYETLEHVADPERVAHRLTRYTNRYLLVSVPTVPTKHANPHHLHDFTVDDVPPLFPGWGVHEVWEQPTEQSHVWLLGWGY
jgi:hypothetical protein